MNLRAAMVDDVPDGALLGVVVKGRIVVVGRIDGRLYAVDGACTHQCAELAHGRLDDRTVICRFHGAGFDMRTGAVVRPPASRPIETFAVTVDGGRLLIDGAPADLRIAYPGVRDNG